MKKIFLLLSLFFVLLLPCSIAIQEINKVLPTVTAKFAEDVAVRYAKFEEVNTLLDYGTVPKVDSSYSSDYRKSHTFTPDYALPNGHYRFILAAQDHVGNWKEYIYEFVVNVAETDIRLVEPNAFGFSQESPFDVKVVTGRPSVCKYAGVPVQRFSDVKLKYFDVTGENTSDGRVTEHIIYNMTATKGFPKALFVMCNDALGRDVSKQFTMTLDTDPPTFTSTGFIPNPLNEYPDYCDLCSSLRLVADEPILCKFTTNENTSYQNMVPFDSYDYTLEAFTETQTEQMDYNPETIKDDKTFYAQCEDRAGHLSKKVTETANIDLTAGLSIKIDSPASFSANTAVFLNLSTNMRAYCFYKGTPPAPESFTDPNSAMSSSEDNLSRTHFKDLGIYSSGTYSASIYCRSPAGVGFEESEATKTYSFTIDTTPPSAPTINVTPIVCTNSLSASFNATDDISDIAEYIWKVGGGGVIFNNGTTSDESVTVSKFENGTAFNLTPDQTYSFLITAVDKAGNIGPEKPSDTIKFDATGISCDTTPPTITITREEGYEYAELTCEDDASGCRNIDSYYGSSYQEPCVPTQAYLPPVIIPMLRSAIICYNISDNAGNAAVGSRTINLNASNATGEAGSCPGGVDQDGDGYGERCPLGPDCNDTASGISVGCDSGCLMDLDGDGYGVGCFLGNDCNGLDSNQTKKCVNNCISDNDGDGYGLGCDLGPDCNGIDSTQQVSCINGCTDDNDGDGYGFGCGAGLDCNGEDAYKMVSCDNNCISDMDGDGYGLGCDSGSDCNGADPDQVVGCMNNCLVDEDGDAFGLGCDSGMDCSGLNLGLFVDCPNGCVYDTDGDQYGWGCNLGPDCNDLDYSLNSDCSATTQCVYDHDADGFGLGCDSGPDCNDLVAEVTDAECTENCTFDEDCNGLPDDWQIEHFNNTICNQTDICGRDADPDGDGLSNLEEYRRGSDPNVGEEVYVPPVVEEKKEDADGDGMPDACEAMYGLDPSDPLDGQNDDDADSLSNSFECTFTQGACSSTWLNPKSVDTDGDEFTDDVEYEGGFDPCDPEDHPSGSSIGLILLILGILLVLGSVGYLIYKKEYLPLMSPPKAPPKTATKPSTRQAPGTKRPVTHRPADHHMLVPYHHVKKPHHKRFSHDKLKEEFDKKAAEREKIFSKFGAKKEHKKKPSKVMEQLARRPHKKHLVKVQKAKPAAERPAPPTHIDMLSQVIGKDYVDRLGELSKKEGDYFAKLTSIVEKKDVPLKEEHVEKLAKVSKEIHKTNIHPQEVEKAFEASDVDRLSSFLENRKKVKTFVKEVKKAQKVTDDFDKLSSLVDTKPKDFDPFEKLEHPERKDLLGDLQSLGSEKTRKTALDKMGALSGAESKTDIMKTFKKISLQRHVDKDVFAVLLDYLLKSGKVTKTDVHEILKNLESEGALTDAEVQDVLFKLK